MEQHSAEGFLSHFETLEDPRINNANKRHELSDILLLSVLAVICGAEGWTDIEDFGKAKAPFLKTFLKLPNGLPSHDIIGNLFTRLCPDTLPPCFLSWVQSIASLSQGEIVAIDGKTLRRSFNEPGKKGAIHMVSAWATGNQLVLGQYKVDEKSNEITAIPELLKLLNLTGSIVTIDAMGCQKNITKAIRGAEADYVLAVKENHKTLFDELKAYLQAVIDENFSLGQCDIFETTEKGHGRIETRRYWITEDISWLSGKDKWTDLVSIGVVESHRHVISTNTTTIERRYHIASIKADAVLFASAVRGHWGVENTLHWSLDVTFREDDSRIRTGFAAQNMAVIRHIALNLLKKETSQGSVRGKRKKAGWNDDFMLDLLAAAVA